MAKIFKDGYDLSPEVYGSAAILGNFDGVHRGHAYLIDQIRQQNPNKSLSIITFEPHPREFFSTEQRKFRLTNGQERNQILSDLGINYIFQYRFDKNFAALSAHDFIHNILYHQLKVDAVGCGEKFVFGKNRIGTVEYLAQETKRLNIKFSAIAPLKDSSGIISSSRIRHLLRTGYPHKAADLLGRPWSIENTVLHGDKRGRTIGFPTINLELNNHLEPKCGVYAVTICLPNKRIYHGVANIGYRPTVTSHSTCRVEVNIFDFSNDLYGQSVKVFLHHFIREEKKFNSLEALKIQIMKDVQESKKFFVNYTINK